MAEKNGAQTRNRTTDTEIFSLLLYRLSYLGTIAGKFINLFAPFVAQIENLLRLTYHPFSFPIGLEMGLGNSGPSRTRTLDLPVMSRAL